jgi:hypothetical protein
MHEFIKFLVLSFATFLMPGKLRRLVRMGSYSTFLSILVLVSVANHLLSQNLIARLVQFTFSSIVIVASLIDGCPIDSQVKRSTSERAKASLSRLMIH